MGLDIRNIISEEIKSAMEGVYSQEDISDAIKNKRFIHTRDGGVYSPVVLKRGFVVGVNNDSEHVNVPLEEVTLIQSLEERFGK